MKRFELKQIIKEEISKVLDEAYINDKGELEDFNPETSKEDKIAVIKKWIWHTCNEGQDKEEIKRLNKMVDVYFYIQKDVYKQGFFEIWAEAMKKYSTGDKETDWKIFEETWKDVETGTWTGM